MPQAVARADGAQFRFVQQHCAKRDSNAELAAVAAITYSDVLLGMPGWLGDGLVHHLAEKRKISWLTSRSR